MKFTNKKALAQLTELKHNVVIIKPYAKLSNPPVGKDIDIFCDNAVDTARELLVHLQQFVDKDCQLRVISLNADTVHIDVMQGDQLLIKYDLCSQLQFRRFRIKPSFSKKILNSPRRQKFGSTTIAVADLVVDAAIRHWSYVDSGFTKIQHKEFWDNLPRSKQQQARQLIKKYSQKRWWWRLDPIRSKLQ